MPTCESVCTAGSASGSGSSWRELADTGRLLNVKLGFELANVKRPPLGAQRHRELRRTHGQATAAVHRGHFSSGFDLHRQLPLVMARARSGLLDRERFGYIL